MKVRTLLLILLCASATFAKPRNWKDAVVIAISTHEKGAVVFPVGTMIMAAPMSSRIYWVKCDGITYALEANYGGHWPNVTINGHTKLDVDGQTARLLDEDNKEKKFRIAEKIADQ